MVGDEHWFGMYLLVLMVSLLRPSSSHIYTDFGLKCSELPLKVKAELSRVGLDKAVGS